MPNLFFGMQFWLLNSPFFALLLFLSICSVSLIMEKLLLFYRWHCRDRNLCNKIARHLQECQLSSLGKLTQAERGPEAQLLRKSFSFIKYELESSGVKQPELQDGEVLAHLNMPPTTVSASQATPHYSPYTHDRLGKHSEPQVSRLERWIHACIGEFSLELEKHNSIFHLIANVATLLGLLGTVTGMIYAFQNGALEQNNQLAQGISQALVTTAGGLLVAIPAIVSQQLFLNASAMRISRLEQLGHEIIFFQHKRLDLFHVYLRQLQTAELRSTALQKHQAAKHLAQYPGAAHPAAHATHHDPSHKRELGEAREARKELRKTNSKVLPANQDDSIPQTATQTKPLGTPLAQRAGSQSTRNTYSPKAGIPELAQKQNPASSISTPRKAAGPDQTKGHSHLFHRLEAATDNKTQKTEGESRAPV